MGQDSEPTEQATFARLEASGLKRPKNTLKSTITIALVLLAVGWGVGYGAYRLALAFELLFWPVVVLFVLSLLLLVWVNFELKFGRAKVADTAKTTIRAASQGVAQVAGRIKPIAGCEFRSEAFDVPCVALRGLLLSRRADPYTVEIQRSHCCLVHRDGAEVFVPSSAIKISDDQFVGLRKIDDIDGIPAMYRQAESQNPGKGPWLLRETVVPTEIPVEVLGAFLTIRATDSYLGAQARYRGLPAPTPELLQESADERDWRTYADAMIAQASELGPAPMLNVMVKPRGVVDVQVIAVDQERQLLLDPVGPFWGWFLAAPLALYLAYLLGYTSPEETRQWFEGVWRGLSGLF